jgi:hypothetical protein
MAIRSLVLVLLEGSCHGAKRVYRAPHRRWVSGCNGHYVFVMGAGAKAKSVTTVPAEALAKAGQLTFIARGSGCDYGLIVTITLL